MIKLDKVEANAVCAFLEQLINFYVVVDIVDAKISSLAATMMLEIIEARLKESTDE